MKNRIKIFSLLLMVFCCTNCSDWLDIRPQTEVVLEDYWKTSSQVSAVINACYTALADPGCIERMIVWGEYRSDNLIPSEANTTDDQKQIFLSNLLPNNGYTSWASFYKVINYCNIVLHYAPGVLTEDPNFTQVELNYYLSEAFTLRALCYFYLVRAFRDVPLILDASIDDTQVYVVKKSSEDEVLTAIIADLVKAKGYARIDYETVAKTKGHITKNAITALLADIYLWQNNYVDCIKECDEILSKVVDKDFVVTDKTSLNYLRVIDGENAFNEIFVKGNSTESIFEIQFDINLLNIGVTNLYGNGSGNKKVKVSYAELNPIYGIYPTTDSRGKDFIINSDPGVFTIFKYVGNSRVAPSIAGGVSMYSYSGNTPNFIIYRLTDIMLMKAEALTQLGSIPQMKEAISLVNVPYIRANYELNQEDSLTFLEYNSKELVEALVLIERQRELAFEGKRWFDLMRYARRHSPTMMYFNYLDRKYSDPVIKSKMAIMDALYFPINQSDIDKSDSILIQNPFYK